MFVVHIFLLENKTKTMIVFVFLHCANAEEQLFSGVFLCFLGLGDVM